MSSPTVWIPRDAAALAAGADDVADALTSIAAGPVAHRPRQ